MRSKNRLHSKTKKGRPSYVAEVVVVWFVQLEAFRWVRSTLYRSGKFSPCAQLEKKNKLKVRKNSNKVTAYETHMHVSLSKNWDLSDLRYNVRLMMHKIIVRHTYSLLPSYFFYSSQKLVKLHICISFLIWIGFMNNKIVIYWLNLSQLPIWYTHIFGINWITQIALVQCKWCNFNSQLQQYLTSVFLFKSRIIECA